MGSRRSYYNAGEAVRICWDADEKRNQDVSETVETLKKSKWNPKGKHSHGEWRFDVEVSSDQHDLEVELKR